MLISWNWIRDYVDLAGDVDPRDLAEKFTRTTAEVDEVRPVRVEARGLIVARVVQVDDVPGTRNLRAAKLDTGESGTIESLTTAPAIHAGSNVVFAPPGSSTAALGPIASEQIAGRTSVGMILPGEALGIIMAAHEAVFVSDTMKAGEPLPSAIFDDWLIEIDNKSITHRPDLWGHYGIAREIAAICSRRLKPLPVVAVDELYPSGSPDVNIVIADPRACRRYTGLMLEGVPTQPAPLWMQLRLGHVGMRPINGLVDLTNYIMADLGQPMHAFDAAKVDRIEVDWAKEGERFTTLDGMERAVTANELMIQSNGHSVALAGVMGGLETEVSTETTTLLLESANFEPATIRRTAARLGLRTDASARFEKSLDPGHTVLGIQRFIYLARSMYPEMKVASRLSDAYPNPAEPTQIVVDPHHVARTIGRDVPLKEARRLLEPLGFSVSKHGARWEVDVASFRPGTDVSIEADIIEEIARFIGYNDIRPAMPRVTVRRFPLNALRELEKDTLEHFATAHPFHEVHGYLWYNVRWLDQLGIEPGDCVEVTNPPADGLHLLRRSLMPGLLAAVARNRFHFSALRLMELGSVFEPGIAGAQDAREHRHLALVSARRGKDAENELHSALKGALESWGWRHLSKHIRFAESRDGPRAPWQHPFRTAEVRAHGVPIGSVSIIDRPLRSAMDEHLVAWGIAWAELRLSGLEHLVQPAEPLDTVPPYPLVEMDFSLLVPRASRYERVAAELTTFRHPLLKCIRYVGHYEGPSIAHDQRSLTFRTIIGDDQRTLVDDDTSAFRRAFEEFITGRGYTMR